MSHGRYTNNGNTLRTYRIYKNELKTEHYVLLNMCKDQRRVLSKFRACNPSLAIETSRYTKPKTRINEHLCRHCENLSVEDEIHFLIECNLYSGITYDLLTQHIC